MKPSLESLLSSNPSSLNELVRTEMAKRSLIEFVQEAWPLIDPAPFQNNWHIGAICEHLQAVTDGQIRRLVINVPPRTTKSSLVSVLWPTWEWIRNPSNAWMFSSYSLDLSIRDSVKRRALMEGPWYQNRWPQVKLSSDNNVKREYTNTLGGIMTATSVGGTVTGKGGDRLVIDDPHQPAGADSDKQRESTLTWYDLTWANRVTDPKKTAYVIIMQRLHENDLTAHVMKREHWEHLCLPMEYEP